MIENCANLHFPIFTLTILTMSTKEDETGKESKEPDYDEGKGQLGIGTRRGDTGTRNNKPRFLISG
jgi:hypothetical protein